MLIMIFIFIVLCFDIMTILEQKTSVTAAVETYVFIVQIVTYTNRNKLSKEDNTNEM